MPEQSKSIAGFEPIHDAHAIEQVVFVLQVDRPIEDDSYTEVVNIAKGFKDDLPGYSEIQGFRVAIGAPMPTGPIPTGVSMGNVFSCSSRDGSVECELKTERTSVTYRTLIYSRWDAIWSQARRYFDPIIPKYAASRVSAISLNFVDKFICVRWPNECQPKLILRPGSRYVCPHIYETEDLWHSHTGAFLRADSQTKRLLNVNVDYLEEKASGNLRRALTVTTVLTDLLNQPGYDSFEASEKTIVSVLDAHMQQLHAFGKIVFGNIISDEMSRRIALLD